MRLLAMSALEAQKLVEQTMYPHSLRRHWAAEAKRNGITMTEVMTEALIQKFGKPDDQITK